MAELDQKVSELSVKVKYLEKKVDEGNGWVEYKKLVLANQDETKVLIRTLVEKVIALEKRNDTIDLIQEKVDKIAKHNAEKVDKSDFAEVKKMVEGTDDKPGIRDMLKLYRRLHKLFWVLLSGIVILFFKGWIVDLLTHTP